MEGERAEWWEREAKEKNNTFSSEVLKTQSQFDLKK